MPKIAKPNSIEKEKNYLTRLCDLAITAVTALIFFLVPLFFTGLVSQGMIFEKMILFYLFLLIGMVAWVTKGIVSGELTVKRTPLDIPIIILTVILFVSSFLSVDKSGSFLGFFSATAKSFIAYTSYVVFYYFLVNNINAKRVKIYAVSILFSLVLVISFSMFQVMGVFLLPFAATKIRSFNPIGNSSSLGMFAAAILPLIAVIYPVLISEKRHSIIGKVVAVALRVLVYALAILSLTLLFILNNFVYWPAAIIGIIIVLMFVLSKIITLKSKDTIIPIGIFLFLVIFLVGGNFNLVNVDLPTEVSLSKDLSWSISKQSLSNKLLIGSGPATFDYSFAKYRGTDFNVSNLWSVRFDTASGYLFEMLATVGILGTFGFLIVMLVFISVAFIALMKSTDKTNKLLLLGVFSTVVVLVINSLLAAVIGTIILAIVLFGTLTFALIMNDYPEKFKEIKFSFRSSPKYALAFAALFLLVSAGVVVLFTSGFKVYLADYYANQANTRESIDGAIVDLEKAIATFDKNDQYYLQGARLYLARANQEVAKGQSADVGIIQNNMAAAINSGKKSVELAPNSVVNHEQLAVIYENAALYNISGSLEWAEKYYLETISLEPDNPSPYIRLALIKVAQANQETAEDEKTFFYDEAIKYYDQAIAKKPNLAPSYYGLAAVYERTGDLDKAIENMNQAFSLSSNDINYAFEVGRLYFNRGVIEQQNNPPTVVETPSVPEENADGEEVVDGEEAPEQPQVTGNKIIKNADLELAEQIFQSIIQANPEHANAVYSLALIYESLGEKQKAIDEYEVLLNIVEDEPTKEAIREKLRNI
ncbi:MAG: tetratricopeptide repeat protein [bacterium]|nr:tetratricopeptide repeat protein [bacterium]